MKFVNPNNKRKFEIIVVGTGLAGASAAATLGRARLPGGGVHLPRLAPPSALDRRAGRHQRGQELPRRRRQHLPPLLRHGEGRRLPLPRGNVYRLARGDVNIIDQWTRRACRSPASTAACSTTAPSAARRSAARSTPAARPASSCCSARTRSWPRRSGRQRARCTTAPSWSTPWSSTAGAPASSSATCSPARSSRTSAHAVVLATGGYGNVFFLSTNAMNCNVTAAWRAHRKGAFFANPCYTQIHPTCIPQSDDTQSKLTLMSESLRNDGRIWVPQEHRRRAPRRPDPRGRARLLPRAHVPELRQPRAARHRLARRQARGRQRTGVGPLKNGVTSTSPTPSPASARTPSQERYGNLFDMYERITGENPYETPMRIYPAATTRWAGCGSTTS